jgi:HAD superfamily hydrolase (TIGR01459 family)
MLPPVLDTLQPIIAKYKAVLLDAFGVFWGSNAVGLLPHAREAMAALRAQGVIVGILSNSSLLAHLEIEKFQRYGLHQETHFNFMFTAGEVANWHLKTPGSSLNQSLQTKAGKKFFVIPPLDSQEHLEVFEGTGYTVTDNLAEAAFIFITTPRLQQQEQPDVAAFQQIVQALQHTRLPMLCVNPDLFAHAGNPPRLVVRQGSIAAMYEQMGGSVVYVGKPFAAAYEAALTTFATYGVHNPAEILMIGDTPETDIRGGNQCNMHTALIIKFGIMAERLRYTDLNTALASLPAIDQPTYVLEQLRY